MGLRPEPVQVGLELTGGPELVEGGIEVTGEQRRAACLTVVSDRHGQLFGQQAFGFGMALAAPLRLRPGVRNGSGSRSARKGADRRARRLVKLGA
jgi:hypothetical protein